MCHSGRNWRKQIIPQEERRLGLFGSGMQNSGLLDAGLGLRGNSSLGRELIGLKKKRVRENPTPTAGKGAEQMEGLANEDSFQASGISVNLHCHEKCI